MTDDQTELAGSDEGLERDTRTRVRRLDVQFLARPPRSVSPLATIRVLFGGGLQQAGWVIAGFGMIFAWAFAGNAEIAWSARAGTLTQIDALVIESFDTGASANNVSIYGTRYAYESGGRRFEGTSYASGQQMNAGDTVRVEHAAADPSMSRIQGMRSAMFGPAVLIVLVFPGIGVLLIVFSLRGRLRELQLLRTGQVAFGRLVGKSPTNVTINKQPVYELQFEFKAQDGRTGKASARSHTPAELEDEAEEALLYDPQDLTRVVMLDALPGQPKVQPSGQLDVGFAQALRVVILPTLTLGGHGYWAYVHLLA